MTIGYSAISHDNSQFYQKINGIMKIIAKMRLIISLFDFSYNVTNVEQGHEPANGHIRRDDSIVEIRSYSS